MLTRSPLVKRALVNYSRCCLHTTHVLKNKPKDYELKVGFAIATLQDDLPRFFQKGLTDHSIYSPDIVLSDPNYTKLSLHGRTAYIGIAQMLKWSTNMYFDNIDLSITRMRVLPNDTPNPPEYLENNLSFSSVRDTEKDTQAKGLVKHLEVRWKLEGKKYSLIFNHQTVRHIEGVFIYRFDALGQIEEHRIQRIVPPPSKKVLLLHSLGVRFRSIWWDQQKRNPVLNPGF
ncbi:hypothetical protein BY458DRAFT_495535 [Sporodiniella umbellata]|nr:hypothetical protein BY458DRAFT_495535 [Sporodiniella umbellata]